MRAGAMRVSTGKVLCSEMGWGLTRSCSLRPPAAGAWKKRGMPGAPDEYLPTACGSHACERVAAAEVGVRGGVAAWARVHMLHR